MASLSPSANPNEITHTATAPRLGAGGRDQDVKAAAIDDLEGLRLEFEVFEYKPDGSRTAREAWVRVPGKHRNHDAAWDAFQDMMATRH